MFSIQGFLTCQSKLPMNYKHLSQVERYQIYTLMKAEKIKLRSSSCLVDTNRPSAGSFLAIGAVKVTGQSKPAQLRPSVLRKAGTQPQCRPGWLSKPPACLNCSGALSRLQASCQSAMFILTRLEAARCGRTFAAKSKRESATRAVGTDGARSRTDAP